MGDVRRSAAEGVRRRKVAAWAALWCASSVATAQPLPGSELADLSIEELANLEVTSVSRRAERLADAPASLYVITGEDIRRSGVTSLAEALRLAPNLQVARLNANQYAISARGFNNSIGNKLLVLIDGRTVYTPLFSGVFWDAQDTMLEDVERIEVISGPGATLWGANAVNGVINVITRRAGDTQGTVAEAGAGNLERGAAARHGFSFEGGAMRLYAKGFERDNTALASGAPVHDEWRSRQAGFRADWGTAARGLTLQGDAYDGAIQQATGPDARISGGNVLARWHGERFHAQAYVDNTERDVPGSFRERLNTLDAEFQHSLAAGGAQLITWGAGYRRSYDEVTNSAVLAFLPGTRTLQWTNAFVQDDIGLRENLRLTLGAKVERNPYTGAELLPSARISWKPGRSELVWAAASRAVRAPSRLDRELFVPGQPPFLLAGGPDFRSEVAKVLEVGYRAQPAARLSYSVTAFHSVYDHLRTFEPAAGGTLVVGNEMDGRANGAEAWGVFGATPTWRLSAGALLLDQDLRLKPGSRDTTGIAGAGNDPAHQFAVRSSLDLPRQQRFDVMARRVGHLPNPEVPAYTALDARYAWQARRDLELSVTGQNLLERRHAEFGTAATRSEIERGVFVRLKWSP